MKWMSLRKSKLWTVLLLTICSIQSIAQTDKTNALLWEISGNSLKQPSYLFGTIHMICKEDFTFSELAKQKFNASKQVYLELDMDDPKLQPVMMGLMQLPGNESLRNKLGENNFNKLDSFLKKQTNMNLAVFDRFKPMMVMSLLAQRILSCAAMESYEMNFVKMASEQKKELLGLERVEDQVSVFDAIPDSLEIRSIMSIVNNFESQKNEFNRMSSLYKAQNLESLYQLMVASPEMMGSQELLLDRRNRNWIPIMESAMKISSTFFAVGAGHLAGSQGVLELLKKKGYKVKPIK
ncbi:MAG: TraB/GumN family protein [Bacteroidota bacterium]